MSRSEARLAVTSSEPRKMRPPVGSSRPAIIRKVVVLPQPEGPSRQKNSPLATVKSAPRTAAKLPNDFSRFSTRISAMVLPRKLGDDDEHHGAQQDRGERPAIKRERERLHQHDDAGDDQRDRHGLPRPAAEIAAQSRAVVGGRHLRTAPKGMPRSRCRRSNTVKARIGTRNRVVPAATAGQSWPPSPMMMGMKGGAVCASPEVSRTAKAYSFQAKIRQKMAVAAMPVVACGSTTF